MNKGQVENKVKNNIIKGTLIIVLLSILSKVTSFVEEIVLAAFLGTTYKSDAYYALLSIKDVIYPMLNVGVWKVFLPIYKEKIVNNKYDEANEIANNIITIFTIASLVITLLMFVFSDLVVVFLAPGFSKTTKTLCSKLIRLSAPMDIFIVISAVYSAMLQCHNKFFGSQIREFVSHIPTIVAALLFYRFYGVYALVVALIVGRLLKYLIELPFVNWGYKYKPALNIKNKEIKIMFKRLPPTIIAEGANQINVLVDGIMASTILVGAVSSLRYGSKLTAIFGGLISGAVATALFPQIVEFIALDNEEGLSKTIRKIMDIFMLIMIPVSLACVMFSNTMVNAVYKRGAFNDYSAGITSKVFACYSISMFFIACSTILNNVFFGYGDTKTPMYTSLINLFLNVLFNLILMGPFGVVGVALSTAISDIIIFVYRVICINKYIEFENKNIIIDFLKVLLIAVIACSFAKIICINISVNAYLELLIAGISGISTYYLLAKLFKIQEVNDIIAYVFYKK